MSGPHVSAGEAIHDSSWSLSSNGSETTGLTSRFPVYVNVYDLTPINNYLYWIGLGIYHSGLQVHGVEYAYGAHDYSTSGVFEVEPCNTPGFTYRTTILLGSTNLNPRDFRRFMEVCAEDFTGDSYHLIVKNCNHFTNDVCMRLLGKGLPGWINRLARIGWLLNCLLPEALQVTQVPKQEHESYQV
eukprot:TRINITY_DN18371_c0_g1_i1.p1 TRINITY_DN18371_c0_g1~~TRINITY_DN18371_c0_g1_i1.p1  ORF type:complete len:186 (-),score=5.86 TRINITY_DN18371_c0_g1_i1:933-1490(-)